MIHYARASIFDAQCEAMVNPVNCVGTMGKGLAKEFAKRYPDNLQAYLWHCGEHKMKLGHMFSTYQSDRVPPWIINFPTKGHWRVLANIGAIEDGLVALQQELKRWEIGSVAVPALGCGLGGLEWGAVLPLIQKYLDLPDVDVWVYAPRESSQ